MASDKLKLTIVGGFAAAMALTLITFWPSPEQPGDVPQGPETVVLLPDGGIAYIMPVETADGGFTFRFTTPKCARKLPDAGVEDCKRSYIGFFGPVTVDPGAWTRFPSSQQVGDHCQPVACAVMSGDNPDQEEIDIARSYPLEPDDSM